MLPNNSEFRVLQGYFEVSFGSKVILRFRHSRFISRSGYIHFNDIRHQSIVEYHANFTPVTGIFPLEITSGLREMKIHVVISYSVT